MSFQLPAPLPSSGGEFPFVQFGGHDPGGRNHLHFTIRHANWLAHAFESANFAPSMLEYREFLDVLHQYLSRLEGVRPEPLRRMAKGALEDLYLHSDEYGQLSQRLRDRFRPAPWRALILPGGIAREQSEPGANTERVSFAALKEELSQLERQREVELRRQAELKKVMKDTGKTVEQLREEAARLYGLAAAAARADKSDTEEAREAMRQFRFLEMLLRDPLGPHRWGVDPFTGWLREHPEPRQERFEKNIHVGGADEMLTSERLFNDLHDSDSAPPYIVFQLGMPAGGLLYLEDIFPAFTLAFAEATRWPGVIVWNLKGERAFFPLPSAYDSAQRATRLIFSSIAADPAAAVEQLRQTYMSEIFQTEAVGAKPLNIIHTSDLHLGDKTSDSRLITVKDRVAAMVGEVDRNSLVVPVVTGDLMDTPSERHLDSMRDYLHFLDALGTERPVVVPGNHDVRKKGVFTKRYEEALRLNLPPVVWLDQSRVGLLCFNSVRAGRLARGYIDEKEFATIGHELDVEPVRSREYALIALVHHHPCPVNRPSWYAKVWYERWLGKWFEQTEELENAVLFLEWLINRKVVAVLHGHKHIPRVKSVGDLAVIGCGSTVGKVKPDEEGRTYMSSNFLTVNVDAGRISCRLRVERIVGSGLHEVEAHEILFRETMVLAA